MRRISCRGQIAPGKGRDKPFAGGAIVSGESRVKGMDFTMIMDRIALVLAILGGLNWGSVGIFGFDIIAALFGGQAGTASRVIYALVGLAALWCISLLFRERDVADEHV